MTTQIVRNFGAVITDQTDFTTQVLVLYEPGEFPGFPSGERVWGQIQNLFIESRILRNPVLAGSQWSGVTGELLISIDEDWHPICRLDFPSTEDVRRVDALTLAWEASPACIGADSRLAFRLVDVGYGGLPAGTSTISITGSSLEQLEVDYQDVSPSPDPGNGGGVTQLTAVEIRDLLQSLTGSARLDASAVEGINSSGGGAAVAGNTGEVQFNRDDEISADPSFRLSLQALPQIGEFLPAASVYYTQSSAVASTTSAELNDGTANAAIATQVGIGQWIQANLFNPVVVDAVRLAGGSIIAGTVNVQSTSSSWSIAVSLNGVDWETIGPTGVIDNSGTEQFKTIVFPARQIKHLRIITTTANVGVGTYQFRLRGSEAGSLPLLSLAPAGIWCGHSADPPVNPGAGVVAASLAVQAPSLRAGTEIELSGTELKITGSRVIGPRQLGWTAGTGTPSVAAFNAATATLAQVASRVLAIEQALRTHGLIN